MNTVSVSFDIMKAKTSPKGDPELYQELDDAQASCRIAVDILNDLLMYEKLDSGLMTLDSSTVGAEQFLYESLRPFKTDATAKGILMDITAGRGMEEVAATITIDVAKMSQVMRNLCSNAIKFTPAGGAVTVTYSIEGSPLSSDKRLLIAFKDSGCGISKENLQRLFQEGVQFDPSKNQNGGGSGMGLWISKRIVELHRGIIRAESEGEDHGCTFTLALPLSSSKVAPTVSFKRSGSQKIFPAEVAPLELAPMRVMVVDDSSPTRKVVCKLLRSIGHTCIEAGDGEEAVEMYLKESAEGEKLDLILMDNHMPRCSGPTAARRLRELGYTELIIGATGNCIAEDIEEFLEMGVDRVLPKPISRDIIYITIHELRKERNSERTVSRYLQ